MENLSGQSIRGYELIECVGAGGFGVVYRAHQPSVKREVAVKMILPEFADHPDFIERFETEAQLVARLEHPYIIPLYEYWRDEEGAFLVMRWLKGGSLREGIECGPLELPELARLLEQIGGALAFSHDHGVIHRDLKPENILLDEDENTYLTDFGIAKDLSGPGVTETGKIMGSVDYLSPEQAKGEKITPQTDIYALGVVLYELLTCEHPFPDSTPIQMIQKQLNEPLPFLTEKRSDLPPWVDEIIQRATAKAQDDRYPDVEALLDDFRQAMTSPEARMLVPELPAFLIEEREPIEREREVFVARERELAWLGKALEASVEGQGSVHFVVGNAGRGKTALLHEFIRQAEERIPDLLIASGICNMHSGVGDPYLPFRQIIEVLTGDVEQDWNAGKISSDQARRLWINVPVTARELVEHAPDLINRLVPGPALAERVQATGRTGEGWMTRLNQLIHQEKLATSELEQVFLFEQCSRFLRNVSQSTPLVLVLDDLQWADAASIGLLFHLGRSVNSSRILLIGAYRPGEVALGRVSPITGQSERHPLDSVANELTRIYGQTTLDLGQEGAEDGRAFVDVFLDTEPNQLDEEFRRALYQHAEGHPLFTVELLRAMQERGELVQDEGGSWKQGAKLDWEELPIRVEAVIAERIGRLDQDLKQMLSVASVEGEEFTAQVVARAQEISEARILRDLTEDAGRRHRLVREHGEMRAGSQLLARYKFAHQMLHRYLYNGLGAGERRLLHCQIAEILEELYDEGVEEIAVALAYHYQHAGDTVRALPHLIQAGDDARDKYVNEDAQSYYQSALDVARDDRQRASLLKELGRVQVRQGSFDEGLENWQNAIAQYKLLEDWSAVAWLYARSARERSVLAHDEPGALSICLEGMSAVPAELETPDMASLLHETGRAYWFNGRSEEALILCDKALRMAERLQAIDVRADTLATRGVLPGLSPDEAIRTLEEAVELAEGADLLRIASRAHHNLGLILSNIVSYREGRDHVWKAVEIARARGNLEGQMSSLSNYAWVSMWMGKFEDADQSIAEFEQIGRELGIAEQRGARLKADRMILAGELEAAVQMVENVRTYFRDRGELQQEYDAAEILANALIELHQYQKAIVVLAEAVRLSETQSRVRQVNSRAILSRAFSLMRDFQQARRVLDHALDIAGQEERYSLEEGYLSWASAHLSASEGDWSNALESFQVSESVFDRMEDRWNQSRVIRDWAEMHASRGHDGDVDEARNLFE